MNTKNQKNNNELEELRRTLGLDEINTIQEKQTPTNGITTGFLMLFFGFISLFVIGSSVFFGDTPGFIIDTQGMPVGLSDVFLVGGIVSTIIGTIIFLFYEHY